MNDMNTTQQYTRESFLKMLGFSLSTLHQTAKDLSIRGHLQASNENYVSAVKEYQIKSRNPEVQDPVFDHSGPSHVPVWTARAQVNCGSFWQVFEFCNSSRREVSNDVYFGIWATIVKQNIPSLPQIKVYEPVFNLKQVQALFDVFRQRISYYETEGIEGVEDLFDEYFFLPDGATTYYNDLKSGVVKSKLSSYPYKKDLTIEGIEPNPGPLTKAQFMAGRKARFDKRGLSPQQRENAWKQYSATSGKKTQRKARPKTRKPGSGYKMEPGSMGASSTLNENQSGSGPTRTVRRRGSPVQISECGKMYALAVVNPFAYVDGTNAQDNCYIGLPCTLPSSLPCVPSTPAFKSKRLMTQFKGSATVDSGGFLAIAFAPLRAANNYSSAIGSGPDTTLPIIIGSNSTNQFPPMDDWGNEAGGVTYLNMQSEMTTTSVDNPVEVRLVGAGIRIRYAGTEMNRGGIIHAIVTPNHSSLNLNNIPELNVYDSYFKCQVVREWCTLSYSPNTSDELEFDEDIANFTTFIPGESPAKYNHYMGFFVQGGVTGSLFEIEALCLLELSGQAMLNSVQGKSDIVALQAVTNIVTPATQKSVQSEGPKNVFNEVVNSIGSATMGALTNVVKDSIPVIGPALVKALL